MWSPTNVLSLQTEDATDAVLDIDTTSDTGELQSHGIHCIIDVLRYGQLYKLLFVTSYILHFYNNLRHPTSKNLGPVTTKELSIARLV